MKRALVFLVLLGSVACHTVTPEEYAEAGRKAGIRCLAIEPDMTVMSPFDARVTHSLVEQLRASLEPIAAAFEIDPPKNLVVRFVTVESEPIEFSDDGAGGLDVTGVRMPSVDGVRGFAFKSPSSAFVQIYVLPEATLIQANGTRTAVTIDYDLAPLLRHELTHICAKIAGLDGSTWFDEGIAEEFESRQLDEDGVLVPVALGKSLALARDHHHQHSLETLLAWDENLHGIWSGEEEPFAMGRPLGHSLLRYLLDHTPGEDLLPKLRAIAGLSLAELRAHESGWKAWLEALPSD